MRFRVRKVWSMFRDRVLFYLFVIRNLVLLVRYFVSIDSVLRRSGKGLRRESVIFENVILILCLFLFCCFVLFFRRLFGIIIKKDVLKYIV